MSSWQKLNEQIINCERCPRLIQYCSKVAREKRKAYLDQDYWGRPVPNFGRASVPLLIVGLAPGAHGANRTGRMFTGDRSGDWLYAAMHRAGFCNQPTSTNISDGLKLSRCAITAVCQCAPPGNKPVAEEIAKCRPFLDQTIALCRPKVLLALGGLAWNAVIVHSFDQGWLQRPKPKFGHGAKVELQCPRNIRRWLVGSYHPSQQNTFTGRLTMKMLDDLFRDVSLLLD